jgi:hypothetical protein
MGVRGASGGGEGLAGRGPMNGRAERLDWGVVQRLSPERRAASPAAGVSTVPCARAARARPTSPGPPPTPFDPHSQLACYAWGGTRPRCEEWPRALVKGRVSQRPPARRMAALRAGLEKGKGERMGWLGGRMDASCPASGCSTQRSRDGGGAGAQGGRGALAPARRGRAPRPWRGLLRRPRRGRPWELVRPPRWKGTHMRQRHERGTRSLGARDALQRVHAGMAKKGA